MIDFVIRNARLPTAADGRLVDIGFAGGRIETITPRIEADVPTHDAKGCLCCAGLIETHIHLDKSRIVDRCAPEPSRSQPDHMRRVQAVKSTFTVEDIYTRAKETLEGCIKHGATRRTPPTKLQLPFTRTRREDNHERPFYRRIVNVSWGSGWRCHYPSSPRANQAAGLYGCDQRDY
jgi:cytosine/adenosine deaminase-related metal-dependent hydrolase